MKPYTAPMTQTSRGHGPAISPWHPTYLHRREVERNGSAHRTNRGRGPFGTTTWRRDPQLEGVRKPQRLVGCGGPHREGSRSAKGSTRKPGCPGICANRTSCFLCHTPTENAWCCGLCTKFHPKHHELCFKPPKAARDSVGCQGKKASSATATRDDVVNDQRFLALNGPRARCPPLAQPSGN